MGTVAMINVCHQKLKTNTLTELTLSILLTVVSCFHNWDVLEEELPRV